MKSHFAARRAVRLVLERKVFVGDGQRLLADRIGQRHHAGGPKVGGLDPRFGGLAILELEIPGRAVEPKAPLVSSVYGHEPPPPWHKIDVSPESEAADPPRNAQVLAATEDPE